MKHTGTGETEKRFFSAEELAVYLGVKKRTIESWTQKKIIPVVKMGRLNRYPKIEIEKRLLSGELLR